MFGVRDYCELVSVQVIPLTGTICSGTRPSTRTLQSGALEFLRDVPMLLRIREDRVNDARQRLESIDEFRGFSILLMVLADYLAGPHVVPAWLKHAPDIGFTVIDIITLLITLGASSLVFWCFHVFDERLGRSIPILREWGRNSQLLYVMHGVLLGVFVMPQAPGWYELAPA